MAGPAILRALLFLLLLSLLPLSPARAGESNVLAIIVPPDFSARSLTAADISLIFLRKKLYWPNGKRMRPANLPTQHVLRKRFSQHVLGSLPEVQAEYWNELYFHGTSPPHVVNSQEAMVRYVADTAGAIGYVDACAADSRVKAVAWIDDDGVFHYSAPVISCN
ncbi:hypothetical protein MTYP_01699 [Methylophilaceae bacterium]|nr:hypothetical protein MTYP_01699 [Methylophilaceae bacterium]